MILAKLVFALLYAMTPHCHAGQVTDCHYSDSVSVAVPAGPVLWAERHHGIYSVSAYPR